MKWSVVFAIVWLAAPGVRAADLPQSPTGDDLFRIVQPILSAKCVHCHGPATAEAGLRLDSRAAATTALESGATAIVAGNPAASELIRRLRAEESERMPLDGEPLAAAQIDAIARWIEAGAPWPEHWAYRPLAQPAIPDVDAAAGNWAQTPIDRFIVQKLAERGMHPSEPADRRTILRRVSYDLTGLPPTPEELAAFLVDDAPGAYERVVDRLLASPRYGERWARHWMDVVHFAETHGNDQDRPRPNAWPYRDYLIAAFNADRPYARFVAEQLAADVLFPDEPQLIPAIGFVAAGPWDESSQMCIVDDTTDKRLAQNLDRDDMVTTVASTFVSSTAHCARCHDHKFDPIRQADYYALQAVFAGVDRVDRPFDPDPQTRTARQALLAERAALDGGQLGNDVLMSAEMQSEVAAWEATRDARDGPWTVAEPASFSSAAGSSATLQADNSVLFVSEAAEKDTYTVLARTPLRGVTAVQLEVLADDSLPKKGPGRADNGNLHLTEFRVFAAPATDPTAEVSVALQNASADFNQEGWTAAMAIDGDSATAWGIHPEEGRSHRAVFEFKQPVDFEGGAVLRFVIEQQHGRKHLIGRPRLSLTTTPLPVRVTSLPAAIATILAVQANERGEAQRLELARHVYADRIDRQLAALPPQRKVYAVSSDFPVQNNLKPAKGPRPVHVLRRGDINQPLEPALAGALALAPDLAPRFELADPQDEGARRAALAAWIVDRRNGLTWRSIVNRVWHYHFGRGIVDTPNDFGHMGAVPTHPELLDWLAVWFRDSGGSLKQLHRLIVTSAVYRQSPRHNEEYAAIDGDNRLLWRANRLRLDAEAVRDSTLQITGKLDLTMGGPSVQQFVQSPGRHVTPTVDYQAFDVDSPGSYRLSIYRFLFRTLPDPFMESMDCPDASQLAPVRSASVTALQALAMLNNRFIVRQSEHFAARVAAAGDQAAQIEQAYQLALQRSPTDDEVALLGDYAAKHGMANVCRLILNSNEFMFIP